MIECAKCKYWKYERGTLGSCTIKLPPWISMREQRYTREDQGCDLGKEKEKWDEFKPR